jgi:D-aminoacyl-tRNA deacylase
LKGIVRAVVQRVTKAQVTAGQNILGEIRSGLCIFLGVGKDDDESAADFLSEKIKNLRIFDDPSGKMNLSLVAKGSEVLIVSQFTLYGDWRKGNRPSFTDGALPAQAEKLYEYFVMRFRDAGISVATGQFQSRMKVSLVNDGPVTFVLES